MLRSIADTSYGPPIRCVRSGTSPAPRLHCCAQSAERCSDKRYWHSRIIGLTSREEQESRAGFDLECDLKWEEVCVVERRIFVSGVDLLSTVA